MQALNDHSNKEDNIHLGTDCDTDHAILKYTLRQKYNLIHCINSTPVAGPND